MDTITHGILGAAISQSVLMRRLPRGAGLIGALAAMAPDLDIFIRSSTDPTVGWVFHRHFTHSLIFIPIGGLIAALPFLWAGRYRDHKLPVILASMIAYASHGQLDSLTNYGTQLLWPFSDYRVAWDSIGIVDPIYSIILLIGVVLAARTGRIRPARIAFVVSSLYLCFGGWQHFRALEVQKQLIAERNQQAQHVRVMPAMGWLIYWHSVYLADGRLYADGVRTPWFRRSQILEGGSTDAVTFEDLPPAAQSNPEARRRFQILYWFGDRLLGAIPDQPVMAGMADMAGAAPAVGDMRITASVEGLTPLWGLQFDSTSGAAERWNPPPTNRRHFGDLIRGLFLGDPRYKELKSNSYNAAP
ncbi:MAG TPA: metal-dependent hydrolase [Blastocatellia bacterium]|nr:metal-dependent hydrolase [Blastocatellia bacterium]